MSFAQRYSLLDRVLHRFAFATTWAQRGTADLEQRLFRKELAAVPDAPPVLITALPRAGTTILLELLAGMAPFAAHTYRDMPFVLCPMLWQRLSQRFQRTDAPRERAHGDGIEITQDSPEAFEEMIWRLFYKRHYRPDRIMPWSRCDDPEFLEFYRAHMRKIVALRRRQKPTASRYVAKNNLDIARLPAILDALPTAVVLVPFREPLQHAASLLQQHVRFLQMHRDDAFARRYMAGIGHFDFGANLKPIDFGGWLQGRKVREAEGLSFWLDYWIAAHQHLLAHAGRARLHPICYERLGAAPDLRPLAACLRLGDAGELQRRAAMLKGGRSHTVEAGAVAPARLAAANDLYAQLQAAALL